MKTRKVIQVQRVAAACLTGLLMTTNTPALAQDVYNFYFEKDQSEAPTSPQADAPVPGDGLQVDGQPESQTAGQPTHDLMAVDSEELAPIRLGFDLRFGSWLDTGFRFSTRF